MIDYCFGRLQPFHMNMKEDYCTVRNNERNDFRETWVDLCVLIQSEVSRNRKNIYAKKPNPNKLYLKINNWKAEDELHRLTQWPQFRNKGFPQWWKMLSTSWQTDDGLRVQIETFYLDIAIVGIYFACLYIFVTEALLFLLCERGEKREVEAKEGRILLLENF